ncbi:LEAF RUST 10 DISEASE-RESISTANCE LOCUS RECEPTOR-LIKE PROTEIN KINASE-like 1.1 isoform X1 [Populus alba x Populus x berolinensis]|nr:LEAF RUST 10 DISEASE-RESISTANCE LOCUS RECEPTOR-LIKE PROTEIN KINASE-like 1.1 isoform X1 [Populus alba x Populus x berolinensis]
MAPVPLLVFFALFHHLLICASKEDDWFFKKCPPFNCGKLGEITFPFTNNTSSEICGPYAVDGCDEDSQRIQLVRGGKWFELNNISQAGTISITDKDLNSNSCDSFNNLSLPASLPYFSILEFSNLTLIKCTDPSVNFPQHLEFNYTGCKNFSIYYTPNTSLPSPPPTCSILQLPVNKTESHGDIFRLLTATFSIEVFVSLPSYVCYLQREGRQIIEGKNKCIHSIEGLGVPFMVLILLVSIFFIRWHRHKRAHISSNVNSANASSYPSSKSDPEGDNNYFGVPIFSYSELEEATNNFDSKHELGDGGFGTVYYGKLRDGREVAVKRLYEHNRKRIKQFMNEIQILTRLRHKNLVTLYGCTSCSSRELLLVYEYIPNGTVADHLHHDRAKSGSLTWTIRMRIAIETATALAYLHATDIIHRDVKTNNILLDNNFCVKVADFGLSRLFPNDVTHISTAPQGTPGYLDPEYHQCYQLTAKSDVYSFGVVLIELISSMPAVDMTRNQHEINLATLAMNKIQKCAFDELIDPYLGCKSDEEIKRMTTSVAELAFLCLQQGKEIRPCMNEVLKELKAMESGGYELENLEQEHGDNDASKKKEPPDCAVVALLKNIRSPLSSNSTTDQWFSGSTTPNVSN